ncbi:MAG: chorismate synthase [Clostridiales bacterium]|nr:chorismate synthase [Clostridiales bacterium]
MRTTIGKNIKVSIWGGSHEPAIGVDIAGLPRGTQIDMKELAAFLKRRAPGSSPLATGRKEPDLPLPVKGLTLTDQAVVTEDIISLEIKNTDTRSADYVKLRSVPRPGHADFTACIRYGDSLNMAGGGPFSARMTAPLCIAGGIAMQLLKKQGIEIGAHIYSVAEAQDIPFNPVNVSPELLTSLKEKDMAVISEDAKIEMTKKILAAKKCNDSVGGIVEVCSLDVPAGIGGAMYDGLESVLAPIFFGIPAVKGVEFGAGFKACQMYGSENNDPFYFDSNDVRTRTNNHGGILGGITTGMPLIVRLAFKPTPSIGIEQDSVDLDKKENTKLIIRGRHDPCVVVRAVPIVEAALALGILDSIMEVQK